MTKLAGEVALVTGAGQGIGKAIAVALARHGCAVAVNDVSAEAAEATRGELVQAEARAIAVGADVSDVATVDTMFEQVEAELGPVDILINNAAAAANFTLFEDTTPDVHRAEQVTWWGVINCTHRVLPGMIRKGGGRIINIGSVSGRVGTPGRAVYSASKAAIAMFTQTLSGEVGRHGIRINVVSPGSTETPRFKGRSKEVRDSCAANIALPRFAEPEDIADAVCFLAGDKASYITGTNIDVDGGVRGYPPAK